jgi:23S rRNA (adenine2503-C2)-methyltransferase
MIPFFDDTQMEAWRRRLRLEPQRLRDCRNRFCKQSRPADEAIDALREPAAQAAFRADVRWQWLEVVGRQDSGVDGASKLVLRTHDGCLVEAVILRIKSGRTALCVSTQVGCAVRCRFCATGRGGLQRNLEAGEIIDQLVQANRLLQPEGRQVRNIVFMGMGEPFNNYDAWWAAVEQLHDPKGFNMGARGFTVSTVGLVPGIQRLASAPLPVNLAISLHAPNDALRSSLMPVNNAYPIAALLDATRDYIEKSGRRVSFEYVLLEGKNDLPEHAEELGVLLRTQYPPEQTMLFHVNLIPWNPVPGAPLTRSHRDRVLTFQRILERLRVPCTVRVERGTAIAAACGQLAGMATRAPQPPAAD